MKLWVALLVFAAMIGVRSGDVTAQPDPSQTVPDQAPGKLDDLPSDQPTPTTTPVIVPQPVASPTSLPNASVQVTQAGVGACESSEASAGIGAATGPVTPPIAWTDFEVTGDLLDDDHSAATAHTLLLPAMTSHHALTETARTEITAAAATFGYQLISIDTKDTPGGVRAVLKVAPMPIVRKIVANLHQGLFDSPLDEEVQRRMRIRAGSYLPWKSIDRECALLQEKARIEEYLRDEGFFRVVVKITHVLDGHSVRVNVDIRLGAEYKVGKVSVKDAGALAVDEKDIQKIFKHSAGCLVGICLGTARFNRTVLQADVGKTVELFHKRGYPAVRVQSDFNRSTSPDHITHLVNLTISVDQRRHLDVQFEGNDPDRVTDEQLKAQLTFDKDGSSDDTEAADSARAITLYLQGRGFFDAHVTWTRERFTALDQLVYRVALGPSREVKDVEFVGNKALDDGALSEVIATKAAKLSRSLFGDNIAATSAGLSEDIDRIVTAYRQAGYREAQVSVAASTTKAALGDAALTAALAAADHGDGIYVRFSIDEGVPTLVTSVEVAIGPTGDLALTTDADRELCDKTLVKLAETIGDKKIGTRTAPDKCVAATSVSFKEDELSKTPDVLRDWLWNHARPRATVEYAATQSGPHEIVAHYKLGRIDKLKVGKIVIRGNFRTRASVIFGELEQAKLVHGSELTADAMADGGRKLRATGLFDDVHVELPDLDTTGAEEVNGVVRVQERYDYHAQFDVEGGYSSLSGIYGKIIPALKNLWGTGISFDSAVTYGTKIFAVEGTVRIPRWIVRRLPFFHLEAQLDLTGFHRVQDTPQFGELTTDGLTASLSRNWQRQHSAKLHVDARAITIGFHYDFRIRDRQVDALRPPAGDDDQTQVPISTQTGSIGVTAELEQRVDRNGTLSPLAPERGFRLEGGASFASPYLLGQDTFIKFYGAGQIYHLVGNNLILRADLRYDQGIPLGGSVLLPDVERFFAGGDSDVRGYNDDQLAHEIIQVAVPPIGNVSQIRVSPAGGNIRAMMSVDAQVRIYKIFASAVFFDMGTITNQWSTWTFDQLRPAVGMAFLRAVTPFGAFALEYAIPLHPELGDDPRGRFHVSFAARGSF